MNNFNQLQQTGNLSNEIKFRADAETIEILRNCYPELREALINIAIKRFQEEFEYNHYYLNKELRKSDQDLIQSEENQVSLNTPLTKSTQTTAQVQQSQPQTTTSSAIDLSAGW